ncbi:MAG TPA: CHAD domain-containing protein [Rhizomicrobium sp.]
MGQQFELKFAADTGAQIYDLRAHPAYGLHPLPAIIESATPWPNGPAQAAKAQPALLPESATAEDAFRLTLIQCKWHIAANFAAVVEARDAEAMHQMRVGFRRLRVAFTSFGGEFRTPPMESLRLRAKQIAGRLAPARDLDVFLKDLFEPAAQANGAKEAFAALRERARMAQRTAWDDAIAHICAPNFSAFMRELSDALDHRAWLVDPRARPHAAKGIIAFETPAKALAGRMLKHRLDHAAKRTRRLQSLNDEERHRLRIALKKIRYTAEFFAPLYSKKPAHKFLAGLGGMQDVLGAVNDVATARNILEKLVTSGEGGPQASTAELSFAAGIVYGWQLERADRMWKTAVRRWDEFRKRKPFWAD